MEADLTGFIRAVVNRVACGDGDSGLRGSCGNLSGLWWWLSRAMFAAFVFNGTVHEWGHEYSNMGGHSPKVRGRNSWTVVMVIHRMNFTPD